MPEGNANFSAAQCGHVRLSDLCAGGFDSIGAKVQSIDFRGDDYIIYRSDRGVYVHFSDDKEVRRAQLAEYVKLGVELCELRYLTNQMRPTIIHKFFGLPSRSMLFDHNMGQALMLLMETVAQRAAKKCTEEADATEQDATNIAQRALDMAIQRNTVDNTIRYVRAGFTFGLIWLGALLFLQQFITGADESTCYVIASAAGIVGAMFSIVARARSFDLKPCYDSKLNYMMSCIRVGMGGIAGPILLLLVMTGFSNAVSGMTDVPKERALTVGLIQMICIIGFIAGFAERLVPNLAQAGANKMEASAGTPGQATRRTAARKTGRDNKDPATQQGVDGTTKTS